MDEGRIFGQGLSFPPRIDQRGRMAVSSGLQNIHESIQVILLTEPEERLMLPEMGGGLKTFLFEPNTISTRRLIQEQIIRSLEIFEPRITVESVEVEPDEKDSQIVVATINYQLVATDEIEQISLSIRLESQP